MSDTVRGHLEAANEALERIACHPEDALYVAACALDAQQHAVAALGLLDAAEPVMCHQDYADGLVAIVDSPHSHDPRDPRVNVKDTEGLDDE